MHQCFPDDVVVKNPPGKQEMEETKVWFLGQEDPLEKEIATHSSILAWKIPRTEEPSGLQSMGSQRVRHAWMYTHTYTYTHTLLISIIYFDTSAQFSHSVVHLFAIPWTAALQASLSITNSQSLLKLMFIESVMPSNHLILCCPLLPLPSIFPSIRVFSNEPVLCIRWPKYWSFSFSISPSNEYSGLIFFRTDWLNLL